MTLTMDGYPITLAHLYIFHISFKGRHGVLTFPHSPTNKPLATKGRIFRPQTRESPKLQYPSRKEPIKIIIRILIRAEGREFSGLGLGASRAEGLEFSGLGLRV